MSTNLSIGKIQSVDTGTVTIQIDQEDTLNNLQVNQLLKISSTNTGETIVALISKIMRKAMDNMGEQYDENIAVIENLIKAHLVGTWYSKVGTTNNVFKRSVRIVPSIGCESFVLEGEELTTFMNAIGSSEEENRLELGKYTIQEESVALLDGNKFFQRHAVIVGSTGSGKSYTVANILEQSSKLPSVNSIIFDLHGEYKPLGQLSNTTTLKIAGPSDTEDNNNLIFLPYWLLTHEEIETMILDRSDSNAPNQARALFDQVVKFKQERLDKNNTEEKATYDNFTIDSPIPYDMEKVIDALDNLDKEMVEGSSSRGKQGPLHGKLTRFIQRIKSKQSDKRFNFIFNTDEKIQTYAWFEGLIDKLMAFEKDKKGSKIIDFSEVPSDILPLIAGLVARLIFSVQQWTEKDDKHPIALFCDEAHLYIAQNARNSIEQKGLHNFERIAKEGRKYGVALIVISQRPADVSKTVLSQCGNFISMRLTNPDDQNVIARLFPDSLGGFADLLPMLDIGECLAVGDACLLPSRVMVREPTIKPHSTTIDIWTEWRREKQENSLKKAVQSLRQQRQIT